MSYDPELTALKRENVLLKTAGGWETLFAEKIKPYKTKVAAWDELRTDMQLMDTTCRQWVEGVMVDLLAKHQLD